MAAIGFAMLVIAIVADTATYASRWPAGPALWVSVLRASGVLLVLGSLALWLWKVLP